MYNDFTHRRVPKLKNMAGEVVVDALPYFDQGYDETGVKESVGFLFCRSY